MTEDPVATTSVEPLACAMEREQLPPGAYEAGQETVHRIIIGDSRSMEGMADNSVHLVVTSPPYWQLKDYGRQGQIGYDQPFDEYVRDLNCVWAECARVVHPGCRVCVNVGDQFARAETYGRYQVLPIHAEVIVGMRLAGLDYLGSIIWRKVTTCNSSGGGSVMGSYPYPRNGIVKLDYEYILLFRKSGDAPRPDPALKEVSKLDHRDWTTYFSGHWTFPGARAQRHLAAFPIELPHRLIRMYSYAGDTVLDPFLGSGVTSAAAFRLGRHSIGYEINPRYLETIRAHPDLQPSLINPGRLQIEILSSGQADGGDEEPGAASAAGDRESRVPKPEGLHGSIVREGDSKSRYEQTFRVVSVEGPNTLRLQDGALVSLAGTRSTGHPESDNGAVSYLTSLVRQARVVVESAVSPNGPTVGSGTAPSPDWSAPVARPAFVRLLNRTFLNGKLIRHGLARFDEPSSGRFLARLRRYETDAQRERLGVWKHERGS